VKFEVPTEVASTLTKNPSCITTVNTEKKNGTVYNLSGQKVQKANKGLYIINGKKIIMK
jgi:myo-inositol-hexaphosphate 3-phosphohydrolase